MKTASSLVIRSAVPCSPFESGAKAFEKLAAAPSLLAQQAPPPLYTDLGTHHKAVGTRVPLAQQYFDQGLRFIYGFNHAEAIRSFTRAAELDPTCAMCYWGEAFAFGPNINAPMDSASALAAYTAAQRAVALLDPDSGRECVSEGSCAGLLLESPRGGGGFGYDPLFVPAGYDLSFGEMDPEIKHRISHRARAFEKLVEALREV